MPAKSSSLGMLGQVVGIHIELILDSNLVDLDSTHCHCRFQKKMRSSLLHPLLQQLTVPTLD